jgi:hypothetical protein
MTVASPWAFWIVLVAVLWTICWGVEKVVSWRRHRRCSQCRLRLNRAQFALGSEACFRCVYHLWDK